MTHGAKPTFSGKHFNAVQYEVNEKTYEIDYEELERIINEERPRLFIAGASAYPRGIDFARIQEIIYNHNKNIYDDVLETEHRLQSMTGRTEEEINKMAKEVQDTYKCYFMVDMAHIAGLVAAGLHQSPIPYADVVTSTTHKTLRGPRGGIILTNSKDLIKKINKAVFPGCQGGPLENIIAAKAVCFKEALQPEFKQYMQKVIDNCKQLAHSLMNYGFNVLTGGTDNHLILLDLRNKGITGAELEKRLEEVGIVTNKNAVPFDTENKKTTSGLRLGTAAITSRGLGFDEITLIASIIDNCASDNFEEMKEKMKNTIQNICEKYSLY